MKLSICVLLLLIGIGCIAQNDDIPTYHNKWESFAKMREQDLRADLATFTLGGLDESMGKQQLAYIPVTDYGDDFVEFQQSQSWAFNRVPASPLARCPALRKPCRSRRASGNEA